MPLRRRLARALSGRWRVQTIAGLALLPLSVLPLYLFLTETETGRLVVLRARYQVSTPGTPGLDARDSALARFYRARLASRRAGPRLPRHRSGRRLRARTRDDGRLARALRGAHARPAGGRVLGHHGGRPGRLPCERRCHGASGTAHPDHVRRRPDRRDAPGRSDPRGHGHARHDVRDRRAGRKTDDLPRGLGRSHRARRKRPLGARAPHERPARLLQRPRRDSARRAPGRRVARPLCGAHRRRSRRGARQSCASTAAAGSPPLPTRAATGVSAPSRPSRKHCGTSSRLASRSPSTRRRRRDGGPRSPGTTLCTCIASR